MRTLSRHMPAAQVAAPPRQLAMVGGIFLTAAMLVLPVAELCRALVGIFDSFGARANALTFLVFLAITAPAYVISYRQRRKAFDALMSGREGETICTFRRAFDLRKVDPWIIRAVYEEVMDMVQMGHRNAVVAIRGSDRLVEDLQIDHEDVEDIAVSVAQRAGYDLTETKENPLHGKVSTLDDLVMFFTHQRRS